MPKIQGGLPLPGDEAIKLGHKYRIASVEEFTSDVQGLKGIRVTLDGGKDEKIALALWLRSTVGKKSKLGSFVVALGDNTDNWIGKHIRFISWIERKREIEVV